MNGLHDMGGMHGFGTVEVEPAEPVFHERWEGRVFAMVQSLGGGNIDAGRHSLERLDPVTYLENGYYGRWLAAFERTLIGMGVLTQHEIAKRMSTGVAITKTSERREVAWKPSAPEYVRTVQSPPAFAVGDAVRARNRQPEGHTRLPGYARCKRGAVVRVHPAMVYPDDHAHERGENPQYLYTVRFDADELWGDAAEPCTVVHVDLFEPYLEAAPRE